jgi:HK97 family phage major capsid protein
LESKLESIQNVASSEERALTADELSETQEIHSKLEMAEEQRDALAKNEARIKRMAQTGAPSVSEEKELAKVGGEFNLLRALSCAAHGRNLDGAEAEMLAEAQKESAAMGLAMRGNVAIPQSYLQLRNTYGNTAGGSVDTAVSTTGLEAAAVREALRPRAVIESVGATQLTGFVGDIKLPTLPNDAASTPAEGAAATAFTGAMNSVTLTPQRYAAEITVTKEALNQATGNMQQVIARDFGNAIGAQIDRVAFKNMIDQGGTLSGGTLTLGATPHDSRAQSEATIVKASAVNTNDLAQMTANDVANLWAEITGNGVSEGAFVMHPKTAGYLFNVNTTGAGGAPVLANNQIYGYPVVTTGTMPRLNIDTAHSDGFLDTAGADVAFGSNADVVGALLYGDFSNVFWATWGGLSLTVDPFTGLSGGTVKIVADQFFDVKLRTPGHMGLILANDTGAIVTGADS